MTTSTSEIKVKGSTGLNIGLWVAQVVLAVMFGFGGAMKATAPMPELVEQMGWPGALPEGLVRFIGVSELLGAIGLVLPSLTRIKPALTPLAAAGLVVVMVLAALFHIPRGELGALPFNIGLGAAAAFIAWGRWKAAPIAPRA